MKTMEPLDPSPDYFVPANAILEYGDIVVHLLRRPPGIDKSKHKGDKLPGSQAKPVWGFVFRSKKNILLDNNEYNLLITLMSQPKTLLTHETLYIAITGHEPPPISISATTLPHKLKNYGVNWAIRT